MDRLSFLEMFYYREEIDSLMTPKIQQEIRIYNHTVEVITP